MADFKMPEVQQGDPVSWFIEGNSDPQYAHAAVITNVHDRTVDLTVFVPQRNPIQKFNVRHVTDPYLTDQMDREMKREAGGWDLSPLLKRINDLESALKDQSKSRSSK